MWLITAWQHISPEVTLKDFKKYFLYNAVQETDDAVLWNNSEEERDVNVRKMKAVTVKMERETLFSKGR